MGQIKGGRHTLNTKTRTKTCQYCHFYQSKVQKCNVIEPGQSLDVEPEDKCHKFENRRGDGKPSNAFEEYTVHVERRF